MTETKPRYKINVIKTRCKGCTYCVELCPRKVLEMSKDFNEKGYHYPYAKYPEKCVNCKICEYTCPDFAIFVTENKD